MLNHGQSTIPLAVATAVVLRELTSDISRNSKIVDESLMDEVAWLVATADIGIDDSDLSSDQLRVFVMDTMLGGKLLKMEKLW